MHRTLELIWAVVPYLSLPRVLAGRQVIHFVHNTSAVAALVKGYSKATDSDSGYIVNAFHALNVGLRIQTYFGGRATCVANTCHEPRVFGVREN